MSTKAYNFYIMPRNKFDDFLKWAKRTIADSIITEIDKDPEMCKIWKTENSLDIKSQKALISEMQKSMIEHSYDLSINVTSGVSIWFWKNRVVVKLFGLIAQYPSKHPEYLKDYHYQNQTDRPDNITPQQWESRRKFFDHTIDDLERIEYNPYDMLRPNAYMVIYELNKYRTVGKI